MSLMNDATKEVLRAKRKQLVDNIDLNANLWNALISRDVITDDQKETIVKNQNNSLCEQKTQLLELLPKRGQERYEAFCLALNETGQELVVKTILEMKPQEPTDVHALEHENSVSSNTTVSAQEAALLRGLGDAMKKELPLKEVQLIGPEGLTASIGGTQFVSYLRTLDVIQYDSLAVIEAKPTDSSKIVELIKQLLPCKATKLVLFAWILIKVDMDYLLKMSITPDVRTILKKYDQHEIQDVVSKLDEF